MTTQTAPAPQPHERPGVKPPVIESVRIRGFRSLVDVELTDLPRAAVLIGANGSGKSNFIRFFEMLSWMLGPRRLGEYVERNGGADDQLFGGSRVTPRIEAEIGLHTDAGHYDYRFALSYAHPDRFFFADEAFRYRGDGLAEPEQWRSLGSGHREAAIAATAQSVKCHGDQAQAAAAIVRALRDCAVYQFHDTSDASNFKKRWDVEDNYRLRADGGNLAAVLYRLEREDTRRYEFICWQIGRILPDFDRFVIEESYGKVALRWRAKWSDKVFGAHLTSDGSLRAFALATLLNLPPEMLPNVILLDEPELGINPFAAILVAAMAQSMSADRQVIVATQSPAMLDQFKLNEITVLDLQDGQTSFRRLEPDNYEVWFDDGFSTGDLWQKNLLGGLS